MEMQRVHRMRRNERLETLSAHYGVPVCMIMRANGFDNAEDILSCRELKIPRRCYCLTCSVKKTAEAKEYTVQPDDTLYGIARHFGLTMRIIQKANGLGDTAKIHTGMTLRIPDIQGERYCVREGEGIEDIARRYNITVERIRKQNFIEPAETIQAGMQLILGT